MFLDMCNDMWKWSRRARLGAVIPLTLAAVLGATALLALLPTPAQAVDADHLILSQVVVWSHTDPACSEYIEITNPTDASIDLSDIYISLYNYDQPSDPNVFYYLVVLEAGQQVD